MWHMNSTEGRKEGGQREGRQGGLLSFSLVIFKLSLEVL